MLLQTLTCHQAVIFSLEARLQQGALEKGLTNEKPRALGRVLIDGAAQIRRGWMIAVGTAVTSRPGQIGRARISMMASNTNVPFKGRI